jgi:hypothetical protein
VISSAVLARAARQLRDLLGGALRLGRHDEGVLAARAAHADTARGHA